jgi:hypothetical protein
MNTYQSPYIDGQVVDADSTEGVRKGAEAPLPVPQPEKISGCTKSASDCLHKTTKLAREFNHGTVSAAHLILAMTLIPNASRQFEIRKLDIDRAFRAAMLALMEIERGSPSNGALPALSEEFNVIVTLAQELARNRDNQEVSVDDLLTALDRLPADSSAAQLVRGERRNGAGAIDMLRAVDQFSLAVNQQFQEVRRLIDALRLDLPGEDLQLLKTYLEMRDGALEQQVRTGFADLGRRIAPVTASAGGSEPPDPPGPDQRRAPEEESIWRQLFGRKAEAPARDPVESMPPPPPRWGPLNETGH